MLGVRAVQPRPHRLFRTTSPHALYLVGGIAVPDDELPILGGADQQPGGGRGVGC